MGCFCSIKKLQTSIYQLALPQKREMIQGWLRKVAENELWKFSETLLY